MLSKTNQKIVRAKIFRLRRNIQALEARRESLQSTYEADPCMSPESETAKSLSVVRSRLNASYTTLFAAEKLLERSLALEAESIAITQEYTKLLGED